MIRFGSLSFSFGKNELGSSAGKLINGVFIFINVLPAPKRVMMPANDTERSLQHWSHGGRSFGSGLCATAFWNHFLVPLQT